jgi:hypothetical protein
MLLAPDEGGHLGIDFHCARPQGYHTVELFDMFVPSLNVNKKTLRQVRSPPSKCLRLVSYPQQAHGTCTFCMKKPAPCQAEVLCIMLPYSQAYESIRKRPDEVGSRLGKAVLGIAVGLHPSYNNSNPVQPCPPPGHLRLTLSMTVSQADNAPSRASTCNGRHPP